jgi:hypothetical protein
MAGTGLASASAGSQTRAASRAPSASGMKTLSISRTWLLSISILPVIGG